MSLPTDEEDGGCLIVADGVSKFFTLGNPSLFSLIWNDPENLPHFQALHDISCEVKEGEFLGILGRNGAGKSTFLRILGGVIPPDRGMVRAYGERFAIYELGGGANPLLSGRAYSRWWLHFLGTPQNRIDDLVEGVREFSELGEYFDQPVRTYSSGMGARLYFAVATCTEAKILLIDEALSVGDENFQRKCWRRLRKKIEAGASGVLVSHDWVSVLRLCKRAMVLENGKRVTLDVSHKAVRTYLGTGLTAVSNPVARFGELPPAYHGQSGGATSLEFPVVVHEETELEFGYSIELMRPGWGWNSLLLETGIRVPSAPGVHVMKITFDPLPFAPGTYELSLFLSKADKECVDRSVDAIGWLQGDSLPLHVTGEGTSEGIAQMAIQLVMEGERK